MHFSEANSFVQPQQEMQLNPIATQISFLIVINIEKKIFEQASPYCHQLKMASLHYRMVWVGSGLKDHLLSNPIPLDQAA